MSERSIGWLKQAEKDLGRLNIAGEAINAAEEILGWCRDIIGR